MMKRIISVFVFLSFFQSLFAQWKPMGGLVGGEIWRLMKAGNNLYAGSVRGNIFISENEGDSWEIFTDGIPFDEAYFYDFAVSGDYVFAVKETGVYRTSPGGSSWTSVSQNFPAGCSFGKFVVKDGGLFVFSSCGLYLSTDNGDSWELIDPAAGFGIPVCTMVNGPAIYAGYSADGLIVSTDNGHSWEPFGSNWPSLYASCLAAKDQYLFWGTGDAGLFRSGDNGLTWTAINAGLGANSNSVRDIDVVGDSLYLATFDGVYWSVDNGETWNPVAGVLRDIKVVLLNGNRIYAASGNSGIYKCETVAGNWSAINTGLDNLTISGIADKGPDLFAASYLSGIFRSSDGGVNWTAVSNGLTSKFVNELLVYDTNIYVSLTYFGAFRSSNNGASWMEINNGLTSNAITCFDAKDGIVFTGTSGGGVFRSFNEGSNWAVSNQGLTNKIVHSLAHNESTVYAGTQKGVFQSENNGETWTNANAGMENMKVNALALKDNYIFAGTEWNGIMRSAGNGASWTPVNAGIPLNVNGNGKYFETAALLVKGNSLFASFKSVNDSRVLVSDDNGDTWTFISDGLDFGAPRCMAIYGDNILLGTFGRSIWSRPLSEVSGVAIVDAVDNQLDIYPNPSAGMINIILPGQVDGQIYTVYNQWGQPVLSGKIYGETNMIDVKQLVSGVYYFTIAGTGIATPFIRK